LENLSVDDGLELLLKLSKKPSTESNRENARAMCSGIHGHPLAISSVVSVVLSSRIALDDYLDEYTNIDLIRKSTPMSGPEAPYSFNLGQVWKARYHNLRNESRPLLNVLSFLDADGIEEQLIQTGSHSSSNTTLREFRDTKKLRSSREDLCITGLIYRNED